MVGQVGDLKMDKNKIACSGLMVRHLVMPGNLEGTYHILKFLKEEVSPHTHVNIMSQYRPMGDARKIEALSRPVTPGEFRKAMNMAKGFNLKILR